MNEIWPGAFAPFVPYVANGPGRPSSTPVSKDRFVDIFNEVVQVDIFVWNHAGTQYPVLHRIDERTRFSQDWFVNCKSIEDTLQMLFRGWFKICQPPKLFLIDHEGALGGDDIATFLDRHKVHR